MSRTDRVKNKYTSIYTNLEYHVTRFIQGSTAPADETYETLQVLTDGIWSATSWAMQLGRQPAPQEQTEYLNRYLNNPGTWAQHGAVKSGTRRDMIMDRDAVYAATARPYAQDADLVLDLGCGWGHRMVDLYRAGVRAQFYGGDRYDECRSILTAVSGLFPGMKARFFPFDFLAPDFSAVDGDYKRVCVFTCHAIEQIPEIGTALIDAVLNRFPSADITGVHLEPLVFQINPDHAGGRAYAARHEYNHDLLSVVTSHPLLDVIKTEAAIFDSGDDNPTSLLVWRARR